MRCPECNKFFKINWIVTNRKKDEMGHFYLCDCGCVISPEGGYFTFYEKLKNIMKEWILLKKGFENKNITQWF